MTCYVEVQDLLNNMLYNVMGDRVSIDFFINTMIEKIDFASLNLLMEKHKKNKKTRRGCNID